MPNRRHVLPPHHLKTFGASPLYCDPTTNNNTILASSSSKNPSSSPKSNDEQPTTIIGISLKGWTIKTSSQTPIANESENDLLTNQLQKAVLPIQKCLSPPEILFINSYVSLTYDNDSAAGPSSSPPTKDSRQISFHFNTRDALLSWAVAHRYMTTTTTIGGSMTDNDDKNNKFHISVIHTIDAKLWNDKGGGVMTKNKIKNDDDDDDQRRRRNENGNDDDDKKNNNNNMIVFHPNPDTVTHATTTTTTTTTVRSRDIGTRDEYNFDWTYSTPYTGTVTTTNGDGSRDDTTTTTAAAAAAATSSLWHHCDSSGIDMSLLRDTTQPILLFDDVRLYEDDLHDNGDVSLSVKIRVMPSCFFVLMRLFLRVDNVLIRNRDTRLFHKFGSDVVCRDVCWREAQWEELSGLNLPNDAWSWRDERGMALVDKLPVVDGPDGIDGSYDISLGGI